VVFEHLTPDALIQMASFSYEHYVYLVRCAVHNPEDFEPLYDSEVIEARTAPIDRPGELAGILQNELVSSLKNVITYSREALKLPVVPDISQPDFNDLRVIVHSAVARAEISDLVDAENPWWGESGAPNPLRHRLNFIRLAAPQKWRQIPLLELLDGHPPHPVIARRLPKR